MKSLICVSTFVLIIEIATCQQQRVNDGMVFPDDAGTYVRQPIVSPQNQYWAQNPIPVQTPFRTAPTLLRSQVQTLPPSVQVSNPQITTTTTPNSIRDDENFVPLSTHQINRRGETPGNLKFISKFAWKLFSKSKLKDPESNYILSPISVQLCLSILERAAEGVTKEQFNYLIGSPVPEIIGSSVSSMQPMYSKNELQSATAMFVSNTYQLNDTFYANARKSLVGVYGVDFTNIYKTSDEINSWVSQVTKQQINEIVQPNAQLAGLKLLLSNAIYFRGLWKHPFNETEQGFFNPIAHQQQMTTFMKIKRNFVYGEGMVENLGYRWIELPYDSNEFSMIIVLPKQRYGLLELIAAMGEEDFHELTNGVEKSYKKRVNLKLPKFAVKSSFSVVNTLIKLGLTQPFTQLSYMPYLAKGQNVKIDDAIQQAILTVDEKGTTASAVTTFSVIALSSGTFPIEEVDFFVDQPFLSIIIDKKQVLPIFISKIFNP